MTETRELIAEAIWNKYNPQEFWVPWSQMASKDLSQETLLAEADAIIEVLKEHGKEIVDGAQVCGLCRNCQHFSTTVYYFKTMGKEHETHHDECKLGHWDESMPNWGCVDFEPKVTDD